MKKVHFGDINIINVMNISNYMEWISSPSEIFSRNLKLLSIIKKKYGINRRIHDLSDIIKNICSSEYIESVDITIGDTDDIFFKDLVHILNIVMNKYGKNINIYYNIHKETLFNFNDGLSNPSFGETLECVYNW